MASRLSVSKHARKRMALRHITTEQVEQALTSGQWEETGNTCIHYDLSTRVGVVVNWHRREIVTIYHLRPDRYARYWAHSYPDQPLPADVADDVPLPIVPSGAVEMYANGAAAADDPLALLEYFETAADGPRGIWWPTLPSAAGYYWCYAPQRHDRAGPRVVEVVWVEAELHVLGLDASGLALANEEIYWSGPLLMPTGWNEL